MAEALNIDIIKFVENPSPAVIADIKKKYSANVLMKMLTEGLHADITFQVQGSCVKAHRCVLAGASSVFKAMFKLEMKEHLTSTVEISDMSMEGLQLFLLMLYITNEKIVDMPEFEAAVTQHSFEFFQASLKYDVEDRLKVILAKTLPKVLTSDNCWDFTRIVTLPLNLVLKDLFLKFLFDRRTSGSPGIEFIRPSHVCFQYILQSFDEVVGSNSTLLEMKRNPELVWTLSKEAKRYRLALQLKDRLRRAQRLEP